MRSLGFALFTITTVLGSYGCKNGDDDAAVAGSGATAGSATGGNATGGNATGGSGATAGSTTGGTGATAGAATGGSSSGSGGTSSSTGAEGSVGPLQIVLHKFVVAPNHDFIVAGSVPTQPGGSYQVLSRWTSEGEQLWSTSVPDAEGNWDPSAKVGGGGIADLAVTADDEVFALAGNLPVGTVSDANRTQYLAKFDGAGTLLWSKPLPGEPNVGNLPEASYLAVDGGGNAAVFVFNRAAGSHLQRYDPDGKLLWDIDVEVSDVPGGQAFAVGPEIITADDDGNIYLNAEGKVADADGNFVELQSFSPDGDLLWQSTTAAGDYIAVTNDGSRLYGIWTAWGNGTFAGIMLTAFDGNSGALEWTKTITAASCTGLDTCNVQSFGISVAAVDGNAVIGGTTTGVVPDQTEVTTSGGALAMSFDPDGNLVWSRQLHADQYESNVGTGPGGGAFLFLGSGIKGTIYDLLQ